MLKEYLDENEIFDELYRCYHGLFFVALRYTKSKETAKEVLQDLVVTLQTKKPSFENTHQCKSYFYKTVKNEAINISIRQKRILPLEEGILESIDGHASDMKSDIEDSITRICLESLTKHHPAKIAEAFAAYVLDDVPIEALAAELGMKPKTLRKRFERIKKEIVEKSSHIDIFGYGKNKCRKND